MSVITSAIAPAPSAVTAPRLVTSSAADSEATKKGKSRATRYTPATTIVAECTSALTGVGPSMASGSQTWNGNCADLPMAPMRMRSAAPVTTASERSPFASAAKIPSGPESSKVPVCAKSSRMPMSRPTSPTRVVMKAFLAASAAERRS